MENKRQSGIYGVMAGDAPGYSVECRNRCTSQADRVTEICDYDTLSIPNGSSFLSCIMPMCLFCYEQEKNGELDRKAAIESIHAMPALTHARLRDKIACGLCYFMVSAILDDAEGTPLAELLQRGVTDGWRFYTLQRTDPSELAHCSHLLDLRYFAALGASAVCSVGNVIRALEAAVWLLITTDSYADCTLRAGHFGSCSRIAAAIACGLAGLYYGVESIPAQ